MFNKTIKEDDESHLGYLQMNPSPIYWLIPFLMIVVIFVFYKYVIEPNAAQAVAALGAGATTNPWVILKDLEQQICISISAVCLFLVIFKLKKIAKDIHLSKQNLIESFGMTTSTDIEAVLDTIKNSEHRHSAPYSTWRLCIERFKNTAQIPDAAAAIKDSIDMVDRQIEAGNNLIRYMIWAIPSIGFVGTVRGIGSALAQAEAAVGGDISGMVDKLGVAFNSTLVSLLLSLGLMFLLHLLNNRQDNLSICTYRTCEKHLLELLHNQPKAI